MTASAPAVAAPQYSPWRLRWVLAVLLVSGVFSLVDRQLMSILAEPIRREFSLSDTELGLLTGLAFALLYATVGVPMARLADRTSRKLILAGSIALWSAFTCLTVFVRSFPGLVLARVGVGVGESGFGPASQALIADMFPLDRRARALAITLLAIPIGQLLGNAGGGWIAHHYGWRSAFLWLGAPGLLVAMLILTTVPEPLRGGSDGLREPVAGERLLPTLGVLWRRKGYRYLCLAMGLHTLVGYGLAAWLPAFFIRSHGMALDQVGLTVGLMIGVSGFAGTLIGGAAVDTLVRRDVRWYAWWGALAVGLIVPFALCMYLAPTPALAIAAGSVMFLIAASKNPGSAALVQALAPPHARAVAAAVFQLVLNLVGLGLGPLLAGMISDRLQPTLGAESLRYALIIVTFFNLGAAFCYWLASRTLKDDIATARLAATAPVMR